jgi:hypothetical protein
MEYLYYIRNCLYTNTIEGGKLQHGYMGAAVMLAEAFRSWLSKAEELTPAQRLWTPVAHESGPTQPRFEGAEVR